ncbi:murein biosynthesis integral membrane protein MurJ [Sandaracinobacteroides saxicola]|uniref:Probable lipid II flippase MurJ n=1 Tax=Sandaracinobacteroides saxicola TaxID=2759707 RepID=A0A7G5IM08_9SPHN|nr:murein biosynthesis integral membrane protein MurJ [Sandaracinobacteroides saxicola]QMW24400.1 murein biosynthesis integral membrane protein MurJ [Sandaracinobacteroides saxicola]
MNLLKATATIGGLTLVSRIAGFARDMLMARYMGAGFASDAFLIAFRLPNLFRALFAEGAFSAAFVPMVSGKLGKGDDRGAAQRFAEEALAVLLPALLLFTGIMLLFAAPVVWAMTGGFKDGTPEKLALTVEFTRLTFPYLLLISLVSLLGGVLNALGRFWVNAAAPILLNIALIVGLVFFRGDSDIETARTQSVAVAVAGLLQFLWLLHACHRAGVAPRLRLPRLTPDVRTMLARIGPAALGAGAVQINLLVSTLLAARFLDEGSVSYLYYADRLNQLPLGLVGIGVGTALLPAMARLLASDDAPAAMHQQNRAIELVLLLTLPAAAALVVSAEPIISALLQHGEFTRADTVKCAAALAAFSLGLPAYVLIKVLTPGFHARGDTKMPVRIAVASMLVNLVGNLTLIWPLAHVGIALSTAAAAWVNAGALWWVLRRRRQFSIDARLARVAPRLLLAAVAMAVGLWFAGDVMMTHTQGSWLERGLALAVLMAAGAAVYFGVAALTGAARPADLRAAFRRR